MTDVTSEKVAAATGKAARAARERREREPRPVHLLVQEDPEDGHVTDMELFTSEIEARRGLDSRSREWSYVQLVPGSSYRSRTRQGQLP